MVPPGPAGGWFFGCGGRSPCPDGFEFELSEDPVPDISILGVFCLSDSGARVLLAARFRVSGLGSPASMFWMTERRSPRLRSLSSIVGESEFVGEVLSWYRRSVQSVLILFLYLVLGLECSRKSSQ